MIDDLSKTIKAQLYERINSPLLGSFLVSWATWNYRFIVALFSEMSVEKTFIYIDQALYPNWFSVLGMHVIGPLATTAFLIFAYPFPAKFVYVYARKRQKELKEIQQKIDDETPLTKEEAKEIRYEALQNTLEFETLVQRREQEISRLRLEISSLQEKISPPETGSHDSLKQIKTKSITEKPLASSEQQDLTDEQIKFLNLLVSRTASGLVHTSDFLNQLGGTPLKTQYNRDILKKLDYITDSVGYLKVTSAGRAYLIEHSPRNE